MDNFLSKYLPSFYSVGPWLSKMGALYTIILGIGFAFFLIEINCIPIPPVDPNTTTLPLWQVIYLIGWPMLFVAMWFIGTQTYLRTGGGTKIGLAYDGHAVNISDWKRTRRVLSDLLKNGQIKNRVSLRFVSYSSCRTEARTNKYMKRYAFTVLTTIKQSPALIKTSSESGQNPTLPNINITPTKAAEQQFLQTTFNIAKEIIKLRKAGSTLADVLDTRAHNLHDMLLLFVAAHSFLQKKYDDSSVISEHLDRSLSSIGIRPKQEPRRQIRWLAAESFIRPTTFFIRDIPAPDKLMEIRNFAEKAICYFDDFPTVATAISLIRFLVGDEQGAIELTKRYKEKIEEIKEAGQNPTNKVLVVYFLNSGFLSFIQGHWMNAYKSYRSMLSFNEYHNEDWEGIIEFIDYVETLERYDGICYLQTFYRLIAKKSVPNELSAAAQEWGNQDGSRKELRTLLSRDYPSLVRKVKEIPSKVESQRKKQKSKRKSKPRKNRKGKKHK